MHSGEGMHGAEHTSCEGRGAVVVSMSLGSPERRAKTRTLP